MSIYINATVDERPGVIDETTAGATAEERNGEVNNVATGRVDDEDDENVGVAADCDWRCCTQCE